MNLDKKMSLGQNCSNNETIVQKTMQSKNVKLKKANGIFENAIRFEMFSRIR